MLKRSGDLLHLIFETRQPVEDSLRSRILDAILSIDSRQLHSNSIISISIVVTFWVQFHIFWAERESLGEFISTLIITFLVVLIVVFGSYPLLVPILGSLLMCLMPLLAFLGPKTTVVQ